MSSYGYSECRYIGVKKKKKVEKKNSFSQQ